MPSKSKITCGFCSECCMRNHCTFAQDFYKIKSLEEDIKMMKTMDQYNQDKERIIKHFEEEIRKIEENYEQD